MSTPTVIITGASRGLGAAAAGIVAELGANVVLTARSAADLAQVAQTIRAAGGQARTVLGNVAQAETIAQLIQTAISEFGRIDALINNAGVVEPIASISETDPADWEQNLNVNLLAPMQLLQAALPYLRESGGRVINVSSGAAVNPVSGWAAYCAAKAGLNMFTRVLAKEEPAVTVIAVRPGIIDTNMQATIRREGENGMPPSEHQRFIHYHQEGQLLPAEKPGRALAVLALHASRDWSGEFLSWDDEKVQALTNRFQT